MDKFVDLLVSFLGHVTDQVLSVAGPLAVVTLVCVILLYMVSSPSKKEQYKSWAISVIIGCIIVVAAKYVIPDIISYFNQ